MNGHNRTGQEDMLDAYYKLIGEAHVENIIEELTENEEDIRKIQVPESLDKWFASFILKIKKEETRKERIQKMRAFSSRAALLTIVLVSALTIVTFSVEAVRVRMLNFFLKVNETYTEIQVQVEDDQIAPNIDSDSYYYPGYLPEGYAYEDNRVFGDNVMMTFTNGTEEISFDQSPNGASYQFDTEDAQTIEVEVAGNEGYLILKDNRVILYWYDADNGYTIISYDVDSDEIMKMAESMERKE